MAARKHSVSVTVDRQTTLGRRKHERSPHLPKIDQSGYSTNSTWHEEQPNLLQRIPKQLFLKLKREQAIRRQPKITHAGLSKSFFGMFKETALTCLFDIGGLIAGFTIALQLGIFQLSPWALALYPAVVSVKGVITGLLTGRLSTALHLGTVYPKFFGNTKTFYRLIGALVVLTLATSATISAIAFVFGTLFWGITVADFPAILTVMVATLSLGLLITLITVKFAFISFKRSLDPDTIVYPAISTVADIVITFLYIGVLHLYFSGQSVNGR